MNKIKYINMLMFAGTLVGFSPESYGITNYENTRRRNSNRQLSKEERNKKREAEFERFSKMHENVMKIKEASAAKAVESEAKKDVKKIEKKEVVKGGVVGQQVKDTKVSSVVVEDSSGNESLLPKGSKFVPESYTEKTINGNLLGGRERVFCGRDGEFLLLNNDDTGSSEVLPPIANLNCRDKGKSITFGAIHSFLSSMENKYPSWGFGKLLETLDQSIASVTSAENHKVYEAVVLESFFSKLNEMGDCPHFRFVFLYKFGQGFQDLSRNLIYFSCGEMKVVSSKAWDGDYELTFFINVNDAKNGRCSVFSAEISRFLSTKKAGEEAQKVLEDSGNNEELPVVPHSQSKELPVVPHSQSKELPVVPHSQSKELPVVPHSQSKELPVVPHSQSKELPVVPHSQFKELSVISHSQSKGLGNPPSASDSSDSPDSPAVKD